MSSLKSLRLAARMYVKRVTSTETSNLPKNMSVWPTPCVMAYSPADRMAR
jgi:hypothetical protein